MSGFFEGLVSLAKRVWNGIVQSKVGQWVAGLWTNTVVRVASPLLNFLWKPVAWFFGTAVGAIMLFSSWQVALLVLVFALPIWDLTVVNGRGIKWVFVRFLETVSLFWAGLTLLADIGFGGFIWVVNTVAYFVVHHTVRFSRWVSGSAETKEYLEYRTLANCVANTISTAVWFHAGVARLSSRVIGDKPTYWIVCRITDLVALLDGEVYDHWFGISLPYNTPAEPAGVFVMNGAMSTDGVSEADKEYAAWSGSGYVLIAEAEERTSDKEIFDGYLRKRWANLQAAHVITDSVGRTWAHPRPDMPLFRREDADEQATTAVPGGYAEAESGWTEIQDLKRRAYAYGRAWAGWAADRDPRFLIDERLRKNERLEMALKVKQPMPRIDKQQAVRGFNDKVAEMLANPIPANPIPHEQRVPAGAGEVVTGSVVTSTDDPSIS